MLVLIENEPLTSDGHSENSLMKKKTIFLYTSQGFAVRYLLRTDILKILRESSVQVVILSHNGDEPIFRESFESEKCQGREI